MLAFIAVFWLGRLIEQFVFLRIRHALVTALSFWFALGAALAGGALWKALEASAV